MKNSFNKLTYIRINPAFYFGLFVVLLLCLFLFFPAERSVANSHDYLDHWFSFYSIWGRSYESLFDLNYMVKEFNNYPINAFAFSEFNFAELMYRLFHPILAHSIIASFISLIAFVGIFFLLRDYFIDERTVFFIILILSLSLFFSFLPHKTIRVLGSAGVPLLIWSALNILNNKKQILSMILISCSPFFVYLPYGGLTNLIVIFFLWVWLALINHNSVKKIFFLMVSLVLTYALVAYRSIYHFFSLGYEYDSSRNYMLRSDLSSFDLNRFFSDWWFNLLYAPGQHHTTGINNNIMILIWLMILAALVVSLIYMRSKKNSIDFTKDIKLITLLVIFVSVASAIKIIDSEYFLLLSLIGLPLQLQRIDTLSLTFIIIMCAISLNILLKIAGKKMKYLLMTYLFLFPVISLSYSYGLRHQIQETFGINGFSNLKLFLFSSDPGKIYSIKNTNISDGRHRHGEFARIVDYLEIKAFDKIKTDLLNKGVMTHITEYGALNIGISPSVAAYHGFRVFDGRFYDEPVKKVLNMQEIFKLEYEKDNRSIDNIINSMSYISKHSYMEDGSISPDIDINLFENMNGKIIFSLYQLKNFNKLNIKLFGLYKGTVDPIYVYILNKIPTPL